MSNLPIPTPVRLPATKLLASLRSNFLPWNVAVIQLRLWFVDFLERILIMDPAGRLTAGEALQHPFITLKLDALLRDWAPQFPGPDICQAPVTFPAPSGRDLRITPPRPHDTSQISDRTEYDDDSLYTATAARTLPAQESEQLRPIAQPADSHRMPLPYPDHDGPMLHNSRLRAPPVLEFASSETYTHRDRRDDPVKSQRWKNVEHRFPSYYTDAMRPEARPRRPVRVHPPEPTYRRRTPGGGFGDHDVRPRESRSRRVPPLRRRATPHVGRFPAYYGVPYPSYQARP